MPIESVGDLTGRIISMEKAKEVRRQRRAAKPKPPPAILPDGEHFSRCPAAAVFDRNLTNGELRALAAAGAFTGKTKICRAGQVTIAKRLGVHRQSVNRWFAALLAKGYLRLVRRTKRATGGDGPNVYQLVYPPLPEIRLAQAVDPQLDDGGYLPSQNDAERASGFPDSISHGETARMTT